MVIELPTILISDIFSLLILPLLIFGARVLDVSIGTIRIIFVTRGRKLLAPLLGFFEIMIWLLAIGTVMQNFTNPIYYVAYAGGFAMGNFLGIFIEDKLAMGTMAVQIITVKEANQLIEQLKSEGYGVTSLDAMGSTGQQVKIIFTIVKRKELQYVVEFIKQFNPQAFYSIQEVRSINQGVFRMGRPFYDEKFLSTLRYKRK
ncbi:MAG: DUF2179 domain-containing protein [ANME-2 cluster archaeon]|jgi:uncharacterized protein YebE (UPF0316 family)|nr:DUF2179 domain-containing protein [ANME-2 cluster archaeon]